MENFDDVEFVTDMLWFLKFQPLAPGSRRGASTQVHWSNGEAYDATADKLASMFNENFKRYEAGVSAEVNAAAPAPLA